MPAISSLIETRHSTLQTGIRQRSLRKHCRLGRATELVFVLATGVVLVLGGQVQAQAVWDGEAGDNWDNDVNWNPNDDPDANETVTIASGALAAGNQPDLNTNSANLTSTTISSGILTILSSGNRTLNSQTVLLDGTGRLTIESGGTVQGSSAVTDTTVTMSSTETLANNGTIRGLLRVTNGTVDNRGVVTGATEVSGLGTLELNAGSNLSNTQNLTVLGGTVEVNAAESVGGLSLQGGAITGSEVLTSLVASADVRAGSVSARLGGTVGLTKSTGGTVELAATNTYSGATSVNGGILNVTGSIASTAIDVNAGGSLELDAAALANPAGVTLTGTGNLSLNGANTTGFIIGGTASTISLGANTLTTGDAGSTTFSGVMSGTGGSLIKHGAGTFTLDGNNTYTGTTTITSGALRIGAGATSGTLGTGGNVINNAALSFNRTDALIVANAISGSGTLAQVGTGSVILTGLNSYSGTTTISSGTLQIGDGGTTGTLGSGGVTNNATLVFNRSNALAVANIISGTGAVTQTGGGTTALSGVNTYSGTTTVNGGVLNVTGSIASTVVNVNTTASLRLDAAALTNPAGITLTGTGNLTLDGANTAGFILGGTDSTITLGAQTLTTGDVGNTAFDGVMSGTGGALVKQGAGIFTLGGANDYTGSTTVNAGILDVTGSIASAVVTVNTGGTLRVDGAAIADTAAVTLNGTGNLTLTGNETIGSLASAVNTSTVTLATNRLTTGNAGDQAFAGIISGVGGGLTKQGVGTLTLSAINTYTGTTNVNAGTLVVTGSVAGNVIVDGTGRLRIADTEAIDGTITTTGSVVSYANGVNEASDLIISSATTQLEVENTDAATQSGVISSTGVFGFEKIGTGNLTVSGTNTYTGATVVSAGTLTVSNNAGLGTTGAGAGTSVTSGATLAVTGGINTAEAITLNGTGVSAGGALRNLSGNNVLSGAITLGSAARINTDAGQMDITGGITGTDINLTVGGAGTTLIASNIATGAGTLTKDGAGILNLNAANSFTGATTVNGGFLQVGTTGALSSTGLLTVTTPGVVQLFANETVGNISGSGNIFIEAAGLTLTAGDATNQTYAGEIGQAGANAANFTKEGTGTLILSGASTYTGLTAINGGALRIDGSVAGAVNVNNTGTLQGNGTVGGTVTVASGGTLAAGDGVGDAGVLTISGGLVLNAGSTTRFDLATPNQNAAATNDRIDVTGAVTLGGTLTVDGTLATGYYRLMNAGGGATGTFATSPSGATVLTNVANQVNLRVGPAAAVQFWDGANITNNSVVDGGTSTWNATSTNWTTSNGQFNDSWQSGEAVFQGTAGTVTIDGAQSFQQLTFNTAGYVLNGPGTLVSPTASGFSILQTNADATINAAITGAGGINKTGTGVLTLGGLNTYAGATDIAGGTLRMAVSNALPSLPGTVVTITNGATLDVNGTEQIVGALTGAAGTTVALGAGGRLVSTGAATTVFAGAVTGSNSSSFDYAGTGSLTLTGASTTTGSMVALAGRLELGVGATTTALRVGAINNGLFVTNGGALASNANLITASGGSAVQLNGSETVGAITDGGFPSAAGVGTITLNAPGVILTVNGTGGGSGVAGTVNGTGTLNVTGGTTTVTATGVVQTATTIGASGTVTNNGTMAGVNNAGTFTNNLTAGAVTNSGTGANTGTIASLTNNTGGTFTNTGGVTGTTTVNAGSVTLNAGSNLSDTAAVTVNGGALNVNTNETIGSLAGLAGAAVNVGANTLTISAGAGNTYGGVLTGGGTIDLRGSTALTLTGVSSFTGTIGAGVNAPATSTLTIAAGASVAANTVGVNAGATVVLNGGALTDDGAGIIGTGTIIVNGSETAGAVQLTGAMQINGPATVLTLNGVGSPAMPAGTSAISGNVTGTGTLNVTGNTTTVNAAGNVATATTIGASGTVINGGTMAAVNNAGTFTNNLTAAAVTNTGTAANTGTVASLTNTAGTFTNTGAISGTATITGGTLDQNTGGSVGGATTISGTGVVTNAGLLAGVDNQAGGSFTNEVGGIAGAVTNASTAANAGTIASLANTAGTTTNTGTVSGLTTVSGGALEQDAGTLNGLTLSAGTVNADGGTVNGAKSVTGGVLNANGATFAGTPIVNNGGVVNVNANTSGSVTNTAGQLNVNAGATLTGTVSNAATTNIAATGNVAGNVTNTGTLNHNGGITAGGNLVNSGTVNANGAVAGNVTNQSGGQFTLAGGAVASVGGTMTNQSGATTTIGAGANLSAAFFNNAGATLSTSGTLSGDLTNGGTVSATSATVTGAVTNSAAITATNALTLGSTLNNTATGTITAPTLSVAGAATNAGALTITGAANFGALNNSGTFNVGSLGVTGLTTNSSTINSVGNINLAGGLTGGGIINLQGGAGDTADVITVGGAGLTGPVTLQFDANLALPMGSGTLASDRLVMSPGAAITGNVALEFNVAGASGVEIDDILVIDVAEGVANNFTASVVSGLPNSGGKFVYALDNFDTANGDVYLRNFLNPGISGLAGNVTLTQSLIGSVINRPSSPFVSGLAYDDEDACGAGVWGRATGGAADASGSTSDGTDTFNSSLSAKYAGVQLGGDYACFNGFFNGWDLAFGGIAGLNTGSVEQPVFAIDPSAPGNVSNVQTSTTSADFNQYYGGLYTAAVRGPLAIDLQYRVEKTDFDLTNTPIGASSGLGLSGTQFSSRAQTLSGSVSYAFPIADSNLTVLPVAGFAWTKTKTDPILFDNNDALDVDDFENRTGFVGATVARSIFAEDGNSAFNQFVTATYYNDFADDPTSTFNFTDPDTLSRQVDNLVNENLGAYSELSVGLNYVRILNPGQAIPARQLNASIRADARFGEQLESWGVTGQLRLQF